MLEQLKQAIKDLAQIALNKKSEAARPMDIFANKQTPSLPAIKPAVDYSSEYGNMFNALPKRPSNEPVNQKGLPNVPQINNGQKVSQDEMVAMMNQPELQAGHDQRLQDMFFNVPAPEQLIPEAAKAKQSAQPQGLSIDNIVGGLGKFLTTAPEGGTGEFTKGLGEFLKSPESRYLTSAIGSLAGSPVVGGTQLQEAQKMDAINLENKQKQTKMLQDAMIKAYENGNPDAADTLASQLGVKGLSGLNLSKLESIPGLYGKNENGELVPIAKYNGKLVSMIDKGPVTNVVPMSSIESGLNRDERAREHNQSDELRKMLAEQSLQGKNIILEEKHDQRLQNRKTLLSLKTNPMLAGARSGMGIAENVVLRADRLKTLADQANEIRIKGGADSRQMEEFAIGLNSLLSGSNVSARSQVAALVPRTALGDMQKVTEWLTNKPTGLKQQAFVDRIVDTINRERAVASNQIKKGIMSASTSFSDVEKGDPEFFEIHLLSNNITPDEWEAYKSNPKKWIEANTKSEGSDSQTPEIKRKAEPITVIGQDSKSGRAKLSDGRVVSFDDARKVVPSWNNK